ncbi:MAG: hypothetical protein OHK0036_19360 [Bacteroidia bacterium]
MKASIRPFILLLLGALGIYILDRINHNFEEQAIQEVQDNIHQCFNNIIQNHFSSEEIIYFEKYNKTIVNQLSDWGIININDIIGKNFIVNNTGWYWVIHYQNKHYVVKFKYLYPVNNQYLKNHYARCLNISDDYKLEYSEKAQQIQTSEKIYLPIKLVEYPKYKHKALVHINAVLFILWWIVFFYFLIKIHFEKNWWIGLSLCLLLILRWIIQKSDILPLLNESPLFDFKLYAYPQIYLLDSIGNVIISIFNYFTLSYFLLKSCNKVIHFLNIVINIILLFAVIYLFTHHSSFSILLSEVFLEFNTNNIFTLIVALMILLLSAHLSYLIAIFRSSVNLFFRVMIGMFFILIFSTALIYYYTLQSNINKVEYIFNWFENKEEIILLEQTQIVDKYLHQLKSINDTDYFHLINEIENASIYLQLSKRFLFEDSASLLNFLKDKTKIFGNIFTDNITIYNNKKSTNDVPINNIYYVNKIDRKYLLSHFEYTLPFSNNIYYSFLSDKIFQLPSGFKNFNVGIYEHQYLKLKLGNIVFPKHFEDINTFEKLYPEYKFNIKKDTHQNVVVCNEVLSFKHYIALFSTYFIFFLTLLLLIFYFYFSIKYLHLFPIKHLSYAYKITGLVVFISVVSFYLLFIFSYQYILHLSEQQIKSQLLSQSQSANNEQVILYNTDGSIYSESQFNILIKYKLLPSYLPDEWLDTLFKEKMLFVKRRIGEYQYTSLFTLMRSNNQHSYIAEYPYFEEKYFFEKNLNNILQPLFNIYALLFLISIFTGIILSNYIVSPIQQISKHLRENIQPLNLHPIQYFNNDELGELVKNYNHLVSQLKEALEQLKKEQQEKAWKLMAQQIAHDIKNSLTPLLLNIEYLQKQNETSVHSQKILNSIQQQIQMLSRIADDFSVFAQDIKVQKENIHLIEWINNIIMPYKNNENIHIRFIYPENTEIIVYTDGHLLSRVFHNLIKNSIDAIEQQGIIEIKLKNNSENIVLSIKDNGCGIPKEIQEKIFEPKFSTKTSGKGLGLSIVKNICDKLNIQITFESDINTGTCFYLIIDKQIK